MRRSVQVHYGASSPDEIVDVLVSADGSWQKRAFSSLRVFSLIGVVFVIAHETD